MLASNRPMLLALLRQHNYEAVDGGILPDDPEPLKAALQAALTRVDVLVTSGGVSMGKQCMYMTIEWTYES